MKKNRMIHKNIFGLMGKGTKTIFFSEEDFKSNLVPKNAIIEIISEKDTKIIKITY